MSFRQFIDRLSRHLFWDSDPASLSPGRHDAFLIARIMDRGTLADVKMTWEFYGPDPIREALLEAPSLGKKTLSFFANQFDLPPEAFRAYGNSRNRWRS